MFTHTIPFVFTLAAITGGCAFRTNADRVRTDRISGDFEFRNLSTVPLWVDVSGFDRNPPVGALTSGAVAGSHMWSMTRPEQITISWTEGSASGPKPQQQQLHTNVELTNLSAPRGNSVLVFEFTPEHVWKAKYELR